MGITAVITSSAVRKSLDNGNTQLTERGCWTSSYAKMFDSRCTTCLSMRMRRWVGAPVAEVVDLRLVDEAVVGSQHIDAVVRRVDQRACSHKTVKSPAELQGSVKRR